ncbi:uncharacterized protein LOC132275741 [Cornus florida]|uniref:uncharacterized protein LOC132275741 n=1 Tax=Cornus florida TaxID=4283 RepID=UPI00289A7E7C|nr:uncharacterized protein LOC132275741 [Cornus florida]
MEASEIVDCHLATAIETFKLAMIQSTKFHTSLVKYSPPDMQTLNARAQIYIRLEENVAHRAQHATLVTVENKPREKVSNSKSQKSQHASAPVAQAPEKRQKIEERSLRRQVENMIIKGELAEYLTTKAYVKPREINPQKMEGNQVKVIHARHGRSEDDQESEEVYRSRLRAAYKLRKLSSVNTITSGSISIRFSDGDLSRVQLPHEDPLVISLLVANCMIKRVLIDPGNSSNIITKAVFEQLEIPSSSIQPTSSPLMGFDGIKVDPLGVIDLSVTVAKRTLKENFVLTEIHPLYNLIMGRGWIHRMNGVPSTLHQVMRCLSLDGKKQLQSPLSKYLKAEDEAEATKPTEESLEAVEFILGNPQKITYMGSSPTAEEKKALVTVIRRNAEAFA